MQALLLALFVVALQAPATQIGKLSEAEFVRLLNRMGYAVNYFPGRHTTISRNSSKAFVFISLDSEPDSKKQFVHGVSAQVEFVLPRMLSREKLAQMAIKEMQFAEVRSFLHGKVTMHCSVWNAFESEERCRQSLDSFFKGIRNLERLLAPLGGRQSDTLHEQGGAPLDQDIRLQDFEGEDLMFILFKLGWRDNFFGGSVPYWSVSGKPLEEKSLEFHKWSEDELIRFGFPKDRKGFGMVAYRNSSEEDLESWMETVGSKITWAKVQVFNKRIQIRAFVDTTEGPTIRTIVKQMHDFAKRVKELKL